MLVFSVFLLVRGHNEPGGGFVGGLVAAAAFALVLVADGLDTARRLLRLDPLTFLAAGLAGGPAERGAAAPRRRGLPDRALAEDPAPGDRASSARRFVFDVGVYLVVLGIVLTIVFALAEERP